MLVLADQLSTLTVCSERRHSTFVVCREATHAVNISLQQTHMICKTAYNNLIYVFVVTVLLSFD